MSLRLRINVARVYDGTIQLSKRNVEYSRAWVVAAAMGCFAVVNFRVESH
jgi:hypothetical protein